MHQFLKYIKYILTAKYKNGYGVHSPFLYHFVRELLYGVQYFYAFDEIYEIRLNLLESKEQIEVKDFGAGSKIMKSNIRNIKDIAKHSAIKDKFGELLFKIIEHYNPKTIIELGTSLGIGTLYLAKPNSKAHIYTIEGCPETAKQANKIFKNIKNISQIVGNINVELPNLLKTIDKLDFVYFDGNHKKEATLNYFTLCLEKAHNDTIFYFDDIHWSEGMEDAWENVKLNKKVSLTIDLFFSGIVFFKKELSKQDFVVRF